MAGVGGINWREEGATDVEATQSWLGPTRDIRVLNVGATPIVKGDALAWVPGDTTNGYLVNVEQHDESDSAYQRIVGGALEAIAVGAEGMMRVRGLQEGVNVHADVVAGSLLSGDVTGSADARLGISANDFKAAVALTDESSNTATVWWINHLNL